VIRIVPLNGNCGVSAFFIGVGVAAVFVEIEAAVGAAIDTEFDRGIRFLIRVFDFGAHRQNGPGADV